MSLSSARVYFGTRIAGTQLVKASVGNAKALPPLMMKEGFDATAEVPENNKKITEAIGSGDHGPDPFPVPGKVYNGPDPVPGKVYKFWCLMRPQAALNERLFTKYLKIGQMRSVCVTSSVFLVMNMVQESSLSLIPEALVLTRKQASSSMEDTRLEISMK
eukprot:gene23688-9228_t